MRVSFLNDRIYMAISTDKNLFEPKLYGKNTDIESVQMFINEVRLFAGIVKALKLNEHLWSPNQSSLKAFS